MTQKQKNPDEWKEELTDFMDAYKNKLKIPDEMDHHEIINHDLNMSRAIYDVYKIFGKDSGDAIENLTLLRNHYISSRLG